MNNAIFGIPSDFQNICKVYPPTVSEVLQNKDYDKYVRLFTISQEELEDEFVGKTDKFGNKLPIPTPLQYLLLNTSYNQEFEVIARSGFQFFTHRQASFMTDENIIIVGNLEEELQRIKSISDLYIINENNYFELQQLIRLAVGMHTIEPPDPNMHPKVREMKAKARLRDRIKAKKSSGETDIEDMLVSICCMGIGITPLNIGELSYAMVSHLIQRYQYRERYDIDIRSLIAGGNSKKIKPKYWMNRIE